MATIVLAFAITVTSAYAKTTIASPTGDRTLGSNDKFMSDTAEDLRKKVVQQFQGVLPNADAACTITTQTST